jgi:glutathione S-transferase
MFMLELVVLPPAFGLRNVSPFCLKSEMLMRSLKLEHKMSELGDPRKAPKGKLPFLIDDGVKIADSELITEHLEHKTDGGVYGGLSEAQKAQGVALSRLAEDHLYWIMVASRWLDEDWFPNIVEGFFGIIPWPIRSIVANGARKQMAKTYDLHGLGRHTLAEQKEFAQRDLGALNHAVPESGFLFGESPNIYDFTIAGMMAGIFDNKPATWLTTIAEPYERLRQYTERVQAHMDIWARELSDQD